MEFYYDAVDEDVLILSVDGGLLHDNADRFVGELEHYIDLGIRKLIIDCAHLTRISSYGLGVLVGLHKRLAKKGGDVKLAAVSGVVGKVIHMTRLGKLLDIYDTVDEARLAFGAHAEIEDSKHPYLDGDASVSKKR
jgi:anti-sigma B factor antagonist